MSQWEYMVYNKEHKTCDHVLHLILYYYSDQCYNVLAHWVFVDCSIREYLYAIDQCVTVTLMQLLNEVYNYSTLKGQLFYSRVL